jgi:hypothetical protein
MPRRALIAAVLALASPALAHPVRVFVVNPRVELRYADTYADFRDKMFALVDASHPRRAELVQPGVLDIAAHLRPRDPGAPADALILFPEDVGLAAGLIGSRGEASRNVQLEAGGSTAAFVLLTLAYGPQVDHYVTRYPGLPGLAYLFLAGTDTYYRAFYETFRDLATTYGVYVAASVNAAPARRIDAADQPQLVDLLRDPDEAATRTYAYEAVAGTPVNTLFVFAPDGDLLVLDAHGNTVRSPSQTDGVLRGSLDKAYLTEIEQDPLGLAFGAVRNLDVLDTPVGRLASVTSKDAWMIDVNDRYDAKRPELVIQPEAFDSWGFQVDPWLPDGFKAGGFAQVQRNPSFLVNLTPCLVGNLFDVTFDGQGAVIGKRRKPPAAAAALPNAWIGQNGDTGFVAVAPWIADDPVIEQPALTLAQRRAALVESGVALQPGSGVPCAAPNGPGACENGYRESILQTDLALPDAGQPPPRTPGPALSTAFDPARFPDLPTAGEQRHPRLAARGGSVYVAWQDGRAGFENIFLGVSRDGGQTFAVQRVSDNPAGAVVELRPDIALRRDGRRLFVAWQELCDGRSDDCGRIKLARFDAAGHKLGPDLRVDAGADGAGKWNPALTLDHTGNPFVAWIDERDRSPGGLPLEHVYASRGRGGGAAMGRTVRVDRGAPTRYASELDNKWAPSVMAERGAFFVAWADFRNYQWDVYLSRSRTGAAFEHNRRVDDAHDAERIHDHPALAGDARGTLHAVWADRRAQDPDTDIRYARSTDGGRHFSASVVVDRAEQGLDPNTDTPSNQWHPGIAVDGDDVFVVWQDNRLGDNDIFFARSRDAGATFDPDERVDDSGADPSDQYRPAVAIDPGAALYVAWEDERFGPSAIAVTRRNF